jgi:hypothetical protein
MSDPKITKKKIEDYQPNNRNHNLGTERGAAMLGKSVEKYGAGRSLLADKHGKLIAGNQSQQAMIEAGLTEVIEVETDGNQVVVVKRRDLDLDDPESTKAIELGYMDNRSHEVSFRMDVEQIAADIEMGVDMSLMYTPGELDNLIGMDVVPDLPDTGEKKIPDQFVLIVECANESEQAALFDELQSRGLKCRALLS